MPEFLSIQECISDNDCGPRICCPEHAPQGGISKSYCRNAAPRFNRMPAVRQFLLRKYDNNLYDELKYTFQSCLILLHTIFSIKVSYKLFAMFTPTTSFSGCISTTMSVTIWLFSKSLLSGTWKTSVQTSKEITGCSYTIYSNGILSLKNSQFYK